MAALFPSPVPTYHTTSYPAINPTQPSLSQAGKSVLITGGGQGIGRGIAIAFARASVSHLALVGRTQHTLEDTKTTIEKSFRNTRVYTYIADVTDLASLHKAFSSFCETTAGPIDTVIANAGIQSAIGPLASVEAEKIAWGLTVNIMGTVNTVKAYLPHVPKDNDEAVSSPGGLFRGRIIHVSSALAHATVAGFSTYSASKVGAAKYLEHVAVEHPEIQVVNLHPGAIETEIHDLNKSHGYEWQHMDDISLPTDWAVWAASSQSEFLGSGRYIWVHWDVDELRALFGRHGNGGRLDGLSVLGGVIVQRDFSIGLVGWS